VTREQIAKRIGELNVQAQAMASRYSGFMSLYNAACLENNREAMEEYRQSVVACVEAILDNNAVQFMLTRQLMDLGPDYGR